MHDFPCEASRTRQVTAAVIGNALEWYDFIVFGFLSNIIARLFFPAASEYTSLLMALATFGVGFFMRPIGGILLGRYADRRGRKAAMQVIIALMTVSIALIAFAPTYASIGIGAPILIVIARMLQGFATGGEYASATAYLVESAPDNRKGLYGAWQLFGQCLAVIAGAGIGAAVTHVLTPESLDSWGWRIPFIIGLLIGPVGLWMRKKMVEPEEFIKARGIANVEDLSLWKILRDYRHGVLTTIGICLYGTITFYVVLVNMPTFAHTRLGLPLEHVFLVQMGAVAIMTFIIPVAGLISDHIGRRPVLLVGNIAFLLLIYPLMSQLIEEPSLQNMLLTQVLLCTAMGFAYGPAPTMVAEQFPTHVRSTSLALAYNVTVMIFGGFSPFIVTWLSLNISVIAPTYYVLFAAIIGSLTVWTVKESAPTVLARRKFETNQPSQTGLSNEQ